MIDEQVILEVGLGEIVAGLKGAERRRYVAMEKGYSLVPTGESGEL